MANKNQYTKSELFTVMNRIRREQGLTQKEAYAKAKEILDQKYSAANPQLKDQLLAKMRKGYFFFLLISSKATSVIDWFVILKISFTSSYS